MWILDYDISFLEILSSLQILRTIHLCLRTFFNHGTCEVTSILLQNFMPNSATTFHPDIQKCHVSGLHHPDIGVSNMATGSMQCGIFPDLLTAAVIKLHGPRCQEELQTGLQAALPR